MYRSPILKSIRYSYQSASIVGSSDAPAHEAASQEKVEDVMRGQQSSSERAGIAE